MIKKWKSTAIKFWTSYVVVQAINYVVVQFYFILMRTEIFIQTTLLYRSRTGSNDPAAIQVLAPAPFHEDLATTTIGPVQTEPLDVMLPLEKASLRKKMAVKNKLTPKKLQVAVASTTSPGSPSANTRSKKTLNLQ
jgi:hypothetical protein